MKNILIISSEYTGHGHKSVDNALQQGLKEKYGNEVSFKVINGFKLGGIILSMFEKSYMPCIKYFPRLWNTFFNFSSRHSKTINFITSKLIKNNFLSVVNEYKPDLIVSVHPVFVGSVLNVLNKYKAGIKFYIVITDLITLATIWFDKRADRIISPSKEASDFMEQNGIDKEKIVTFGLPVREGFVSPCNSKDDIERNTNINGNIRFLLLNNSEKPKRLVYIIENLLHRYDSTVTVVCGRSERTYNKLVKRFYGNDDRINIIGYTKELPKFFHSHDILITRSGPTAIIEAINCLIPIVSMGALPGQEEANPIYLNKNGLGCSTMSTDDIFNKIDSLLKDNRKLLVNMRKVQFDYIGRGARNHIVEYIVNSIS